MITTTLMTVLLALTGDSLTVSPIGFSFHVKPMGKDSRAQMPNRVGPEDNDHPTTFHPGLFLTYKSTYMQYSAWYFKDSFGQKAGGLVLGPKYDIIDKYFSIGVVVGGFAREKRPNPCHLVDPCSLVCSPAACAESGSSKDFPLIKQVGNIELIPLAALTTSFAIPITKNISVETNVLLNPIVIHSNTGLRIDF